MSDGFVIKQLYWKHHAIYVHTMYNISIGHKAAPYDDKLDVEICIHKYLPQHWILHIHMHAFNAPSMQTVIY